MPTDAPDRTTIMAEKIQTRKTELSNPAAPTPNKPHAPLEKLLPEADELSDMLDLATALAGLKEIIGACSDIEGGLRSASEDLQIGRDPVYSHQRIRVAARKIRGSLDSLIKAQLRFIRNHTTRTAGLSYVEKWEAMINGDN